MKLSEIIDASTQFIDVRTPEEFAGGHIAGALNIPLADISRRKNEIKGLAAALWCAIAGAAAGAASQYLNYNRKAMV